jgi:hypothetical protein
LFHCEILFWVCLALASSSITFTQLQIAPSPKGLYGRMSCHVPVKKILRVNLSGSQDGISAATERQKKYFLGVSVSRNLKSLFSAKITDDF